MKLVFGGVNLGVDRDDRLPLAEHACRVLAGWNVTNTHSSR